MDFDFDVEYIPGLLNVLPDKLSRIFDLGLRKERISDSFRLMTGGEGVQSVPIDEVQSADMELVEDREQRKLKVLLAHLKGHFGAKAIQLSILNDGFTWPSLKADSQEEVSKCLKCQRYNIGHHGFHPIKNLSASLPFDHICIDVKNMPLTRRGNIGYLLVIDVFTKFVFLNAVKEQTAVAVARALLKIFCTVGFPRILGSDNGTEFVNEIMQEVVRVCKIDHRLISAYHHRANGIAERAIRTTSDAIYKQLEGQVDQWDRYLDSTQLFYNLKESETTGSTPYSLVFARKANALEDFSHVEENPLSVARLQQRLNYMNALVYPAVVQKSQSVNMKRNEYFRKRNHVITDQFMPGAVVMVRDETRNDKVTPRYEGPFTVIRRNQGGAYVLKNALHEEFVRPPNVLKLVHHDLQIPGLPGVAAEVDKILDHKEVQEETHYLVHWKRQPSSLDEWVPHSEFNDLGPILSYHKCLTDGTDIKGAVERRKGKHRNTKPLRSSTPVFASVVEDIPVVDTPTDPMIVVQHVPRDLRFINPGPSLNRQNLAKRRAAYVPGSLKD